MPLFSSNPGGDRETTLSQSDDAARLSVGLAEIGWNAHKKDGIGDGGWLQAS